MYTNCLIAILPQRSPYHEVWNNFIDRKLELCVSTDILLEYEEILGRLTSSEFADTVIKAIINQPNIHRVETTYFFNLIKQDPDDNKFVDCAICGSAEIIVSNDRHFDVLKKIDYPIIKVEKLQDFVKELYG